MTVEILQRNELGRVRSTQTRPAVQRGLVCDGELSQIMSNHFRFNFHLIKHFSIINSNHGSDHFRNNNHITQVGLDSGRFFIWKRFLLGFTQLVDQTHGFTLQTTLESSSGTSMDQVHEFFTAQIQQIIKFNSSVRKLAELSLSLQFSSFVSIVFVSLLLKMVRRIPKDNVWLPC